MTSIGRAGAVLVAGSANVDFVVRTPHIPAPGETVLGGELRFRGTAAITGSEAIRCSKLLRREAGCAPVAATKG